MLESVEDDGEYLFLSIVARSGAVWGERKYRSAWNPISVRKQTENREKKEEEEEEEKEEEEEEEEEDTKMPCSAVTLSLATITGIIATGLLAIAFSTDNWLYTEVKRAQIQVRRSNLQTCFFFFYYLFHSESPEFLRSIHTWYATFVSLFVSYAFYG